MVNLEIGNVEYVVSRNNSAHVHVFSRLKNVNSLKYYVTPLGSWALCTQSDTQLTVGAIVQVVAQRDLPPGACACQHPAEVARGGRVCRALPWLQRLQLDAPGSRVPLPGGRQGQQGVFRG